MKVFSEGRRKLVYGGAAFAALLGGAWMLKANYGEFRDGIFFWLGAMLAAHVTQESLSRKPLPVAPKEP